MIVAPIRYRFNRTILGGKRRALESVARRSWTVCDQPSRHAPSQAIALEDQFDRVTGLSHSKKTFEREIALLQGTWGEPRTTRAHEIRNATLIDSYLYAGPYKETLRYGRRENWIAGGSIVRQSEGALACTVTGNEYFSHWVTDNLSLELLADLFAPPVVLDTSHFGHASGYRDLLQFQSNAIARVHCDELIVFEDVAQNDNKRSRYAELRDRVRSACPAPGPSKPGVMIIRGRTGSLRVLENESEVAEHLEATHGFVIVDPTRLTVEEIIQAIAGSRIVLGVEGSSMAHGIYAIRDGGTFFILQPPFRFNALYKEYTDCLGLNFAYVVGKETAKGGFTIDLDELDRTLDLVP